MGVHVQRPAPAIARRPTPLIPLNRVVAFVVAAAIIGAVLGGVSAFLVARPSGAVGSLQADLAAARDELAANATTIGELTEARGDLTAEVDELDGTIVELRASGAALRTELQQLERANGSLAVERDRLVDDVEQLGAENTALKEQLAQYEVPWVAVYPTLAYSSALRWAPESWFFSGEYLLVVDVVVTNANDESTWFGPGDLKLKGPDNTVYAWVHQSSIASQPRICCGLVLPDGRTELHDQEIRPGEEARGSVVFYVTNGDVSTFTITYHGEEATQLTAS